MRNHNDGEYYYAPKGRFWGVWQYHDNGNGSGYGTYIRDFPTREEARREVYKLNKWE